MTHDAWAVGPEPDFAAARVLYQRLGYEEIESYTSARYSEHWYGRGL